VRGGRRWGKWSVGYCGGSSRTKTSLPERQCGHRATSTPVRFFVHSWTVFRAGLGKGGPARNSSRQRRKLNCLQPLAKKPKCRSRTKALGNTCCKERRMNSPAGKSVSLSLSPSRRSVARLGLGVARSGSRGRFALHTGCTLFLWRFVWALCWKCTALHGRLCCKPCPVSGYAWLCKAVLRSCKSFGISGRLAQV